MAFFLDVNSAVPADRGFVHSDVETAAVVLVRVDLQVLDSSVRKSQEQSGRIIKSREQSVTVIRSHKESHKES